MKADGMKEWKYESKDRKTVLSSPDWFDELPIQAVVMPDAMILPDLGQPASYYAILKSAHTHTHTAELPAIQVTNSRTGRLENSLAICFSKIKTIGSHTFI